MRVESGLIPAQMLESLSPVENLHFSKDAEIAEKTIQLATHASNQFTNLSEILTPQDGIDGITALTSQHFAKASTVGKSFGRAIAERELDGHFIGVGSQIFAPGTALSAVPTVDPHDGAKNDEVLICINGLNTTKERQTQNLQAIANSTGLRTIGIYNATQGGLLDIVHSSATNKFDLGNNPAVNTLADTVYNELKAGRPIHLLCYSQGSIITSRALQNVYNRLRLEDGWSQNEAERLLEQTKVETFGGVARRYPNGPQYVHYINCNDIVPQLFGLRNFLSQLVDLGRDAVVHRFSSGGEMLAHGLEDIYLRKRITFEQARQEISSH